MASPDANGSQASPQSASPEPTHPIKPPAALVTPSVASPAPSSSRGFNDLVIEATNTALLVVIHVLCAFSYQLKWTPTQIWWVGFLYIASALSMSAGYHRLFAHRSFQASRLLRRVFLFFGAGSLQGSALWWCRLHRLHHKRINTSDDPFSASKSFLFLHLGWLLPNAKHSARTYKMDVFDLESDQDIMMQHRLYPVYALASSFLIPWLVCRGSIWQALVLGGVARFIVVHATLGMHSLSIWLNSLGERSGRDRIRYVRLFSESFNFVDETWLSLLTFGEGYQNAHHAFPNDYRGGSFFVTCLDPTKWLILIASKFGLVSNLVEVDSELIDQATFHMQLMNLQKQYAHIKFSPPISQLRTMSYSDYISSTSNPGGAELIAIDKVIYDVSSLLPFHPGGSAILKKFIGVHPLRVANAYGAHHLHSTAAAQLLAAFAVAQLKDVPELTDAEYAMMSVEGIIDIEHALKAGGDVNEPVVVIGGPTGHSGRARANSALPSLSLPPEPKAAKVAASRSVDSAPLSSSKVVLHTVHEVPSPAPSDGDAPAITASLSESAPVHETTSAPSEPESSIVATAVIKPVASPAVAVEPVPASPVSTIQPDSLSASSPSAPLHTSPPPPQQEAAIVAAPTEPTAVVDDAPAAIVAPSSDQTPSVPSVQPATIASVPSDKAAEPAVAPAIIAVAESQPQPAAEIHQPAQSPEPENSISSEHPAIVTIERVASDQPTAAPKQDSTPAPSVEDKASPEPSPETLSANTHQETAPVTPATASPPGVVVPPAAEVPLTAPEAPQTTAPSEPAVDAANSLPQPPPAQPVVEPAPAPPVEPAPVAVESPPAPEPVVPTSSTDSSATPLQSNTPVVSENMDVPSTIPPPSAVVQSEPDPTPAPAPTEALSTAESEAQVTNLAAEMRAKAEAERKRLDALLAAERSKLTETTPETTSVSAVEARVRAILSNAPISPLAMSKDESSAPAPSESKALSPRSSAILSPRSRPSLAPRTPRTRQVDSPVSGEAVATATFDPSGALSPRRPSPQPTAQPSDNPLAPIRHGVSRRHSMAAEYGADDPAPSPEPIGPPPVQSEPPKLKSALKKPGLARPRSESVSAARAGSTSGASVLARVLFDFGAQDATCLPVHAGTVVGVLHQDSSGWWLCETHGRKGYVPKNYVEVLDSDNDDESEDEPLESKAPAPEPSARRRASTAWDLRDGTAGDEVSRARRDLEIAAVIAQSVTVVNNDVVDSPVGTPDAPNSANSPDSANPEHSPLSAPSVKRRVSSFAATSLAAPPLSQPRRSRERELDAPGLHRATSVPARRHSTATKPLRPAGSNSGSRTPVGQPRTRAGMRSSSISYDPTDIKVFQSPLNNSSGKGVSWTLNLK